MGQLYKLTSPSGKSYIGITTKTLEARWSQHIKHALKNTRDNGAIYAALRKYGPESFTREILAECDDWATLCQLEITAIAQHGTLCPGGYNMTAGGEGIVGVPRTDKVKRAHSEAQKRRYQRPEERAKLLAQARRANEASVRKANENPSPRRATGYYVPKPKVGRAEHARRTREAMARPEVREKIRIGLARNRAANPGWKENLAKKQTGKKHGPQTEKQKTAARKAQKRYMSNPENLAKRLANLARGRETMRLSKAAARGSET